jgi:predicted component of type VI protein secretion system
MEQAQAELMRELEEQTDGLIRQSFAQGYERATRRRSAGTATGANNRT